MTAGLLLPHDAQPLHALPEYAASLQAAREHPIVGPRLDTLVGSALGASRLDSERLPDLILYRPAREHPLALMR